ncbi:probable E3 ubiquitin-protein ligase LUL2 [Oryza glaberrima]|uniref:RING-type E3 ubiquitin transferase n=2 Tax=Oryza TaxID=4527 RepID=A0A0E0MWG7_ORYRU|nr:probable E3 ubiquitin-protein ligase LUL2 [Oryza glaberrima]
MGNIASSGGASPRPPPPHLEAYRHGVPPPYYHSYPRPPPGAAAPPPVPVPAHVERHRAVAVSVGVNVKGDTLRLVPDDDDDGRSLLLAFSFDADGPGSITVCFFAQEDKCALKTAKENLLQPVTVPFKEGRGQEFKQPSGSGIDVSRFEESELTNVGEGGVFPVAFKVQMDVSGNQESEGAHETEQSKYLVKYAIFVKKDNAEYGVHVVQQILWVNGIRYVLQEIYGIGNTADKNAHEDDSGKECVVCLSEPRDTAVLPCRHMCLCRECAQVLKYQTNKCPICRQPVEGLREIEVDNKPIPQQGSQQLTAPQ